MPDASSRLIEVALPLPLFRTFTYSVEDEPRNPLVPGTRVVVPLRTGKEVGIALMSTMRRFSAGITFSFAARP